MTPNSFSFPAVNIVLASAGSGKTYQLTKRYVQLLFLLCANDASALKQVLAITFTNKAAREMKGRILDFLKRASLKQLHPWEINDIIKPLGLTTDEASGIATQLLAYLLREYHYFAVSTIDSFINALLAGCAFKVGLSAKFHIKRNSKDYLQLGLDELLTQAHDDKQVHALFDAFIHQYLVLENRGGWLPKDDLLKVIQTLYYQVNTYGLPLRPSAHDREDLFKDKKLFINVLKDLNEILPVGTQKRFAEGLPKFLDSAQHGFDVDEVSVYFAHEDYPSLKGAVIPDEVTRLWDKARKLLNDICLQEAFGVFDAYIVIYQRLMEAFTRLQLKDDVLFLEQLNHKARALFDEDLISVAELYYRLATRYRHYLIDEFQDTNPTQWRNVQLMVEEALSTQGSLFLVGDAKQAIYGFRGGDSSLFEKIAQRFESMVHRQTLDTNRRSQRAIVEFNNTVFSAQNLQSFINVLREKTDDALPKEYEQRLLQVFANSHQEWKEGHDGGYVRVDEAYGKTSVERDEVSKSLLLKHLNDVHQRFKWSDMAVLVRSNNEALLVTGWLIAAGIPVQSDRTSDIQQHPLIIDIINFLTFCYRPADNSTFCQFLLGHIAPVIFKLSKAQLAEFCFIHRGSDLYQAFKLQYPLNWDRYIKPISQKLGAYPLYEVVVELYRLFEIEAHFAQASGFFMHLLEIIKHQEENSVDVAQFLEAFKNLDDEMRFIPLAKIDAVQVLTVHKAKGLEFSVVILPFMEMPLKVGAGAKEGAQAFSVLLDQEDLSLVRLKKTYAKFAPALKKLWNHEFNKVLLNEMCAIYVALTRAVWEMYIIVPEKSGNAANHALVLLPPDKRCCGSVQTKILSMTATGSVLPTCGFHDWLTLLREDLNDSYDKRQARVQGEIWHEALSYIERLSSDAHAQVKQALSRVYQRRQLKSDDMKRDIDTLERFIHRADVKPLFTLADDVVVYCEMEVVNGWGDLNRLDRVLVTPHEITIIDFKTALNPMVDYQKQLTGYAGMLKNIYPKHRIKTQLLYIQGEGQ